ncbi:MAG: PAS domain S-box protein, partial [Ekhidna sp.]|uniref:PAS domain S-box protein n=1 Tax=Ekhidna sp. TaxID=2608089 RepID=UPI00329820D5
MSHAQTPLDKRRIALFNYLILFCVATSLILGGITLSFGLFIQPVLCLIASILLSISWLFNAYGRIQFSKGYFICLCVIMIVGASLIYIQEGQDVDLENMLFAAMAIAMFLVDGFRKHLTYWFIFTCFLVLKVLSLNAQGIEGTIFGLTLINNIVVASVLYLFLYVFRSILIKAFDRSDQHEQTLRSLLDNAPLLMALVDSNGNFILVNHNYARRFGYKPRDLIGKKRKEVLPEHIFEKHEPMFQEVLTTKSQVSF